MKMGFSLLLFTGLFQVPETVSLTLKAFLEYLLNDGMGKSISTPRRGRGEAASLLILSSGKAIDWHGGTWRISRCP